MIDLLGLGEGFSIAHHGVIVVPFCHKGDIGHLSRNNVDFMDVLRRICAIHD